MFEVTRPRRFCGRKRTAGRAGQGISYISGNRTGVITVTTSNHWTNNFQYEVGALVGLGLRFLVVWIPARVVAVDGRGTSRSRKRTGTGGRDGHFTERHRGWRENSYCANYEQYRYWPNGPSVRVAVRWGSYRLFPRLDGQRLHRICLQRGCSNHHSGLLFAASAVALLLQVVWGTPGPVEIRALEGAPLAHCSHQVLATYHR
jgi:hypothetical protein